MLLACAALLLIPVITVLLVLGLTRDNTLTTTFAVLFEELDQWVEFLGDAYGSTALTDTKWLTHTPPPFSGESALHSAVNSLLNNTSSSSGGSTPGISGGGSGGGTTGGGGSVGGR